MTPFQVGDRVRRRRSGKPARGKVIGVYVDPVGGETRVHVYWLDRRRHQAWFTELDPSRLVRVTGDDDEIG